MSEGPAKHRRFRYPLRTLFVLTAMVAVSLGIAQWFNWQSSIIIFLISMWTVVATSAVRFPGLQAVDDAKD